MASTAASMPTTSVVTSDIITIAHTNGTRTPSSGYIANSGQGESNFTSLGASISGGSIIPTLTGTWNGLQVPANITKIVLRSNIVAADIASAGAGKHIQFSLHQGYVVEAGSFTQGSRNSISNGRITTEGSATSGTTVGSFDVNVPGTQTTYQLEIGPGGQVPFNTAVGNTQLAGGTNYTVTPTMNGNAIGGRAYWSYYWHIDDDYPTKDYKFQVLAFVDL